MLVGIEHLDHRPGLDVFACDPAFTLLFDLQPTKIPIPGHFESDFLKIEY